MHELNLTDARVEAAMQLVDRREFLQAERRKDAGVDAPVGIGFEQTTSQPSLIAWMLERLELRPGMRVLEVGTGCGYVTALISQLGAEVFSIEIVAPLAARAAETLERLEVPHVHLRAGDGAAGWPEAAPFDAIVVAAGAPRVPPALVEQLAKGGRLLMPVGTPDSMELLLISRDADGALHEEKTLAVRFVPLTGAAADADRSPRR
jgi:protein-L-isoaspartate(D-aspartate) O-methyltransferase